MPTVTLRSAGTMSPPAKMPGWPVIMLAPTSYHAIADLQPGDAFEQPEIDILAECEHQRVGFDGLEFARRLRKALAVESHLFNRQRGFVRLLDGRQPLDHDAFLQRFLDFEVVRRHLLACAAIDDQRLGAHTLGGACHVDGGIATAINDDAAAEQGFVFTLHAAQQ
jgi:hypothetical protein